MILDKWHHRWCNQEAYRDAFPQHKMSNIQDGCTDPELEDNFWLLNNQDNEENQEIPNLLSNNENEESKSNKEDQLED